MERIKLAYCPIPEIRFIHDVYCQEFGGMETKLCGRSWHLLKNRPLPKEPWQQFVNARKQYLNSVYGKFATRKGKP